MLGRPFKYDGTSPLALQPPSEPAPAEDKTFYLKVCAIKGATYDESNPETQKDVTIYSEGLELRPDKTAPYTLTLHHVSRTVLPVASSQLGPFPSDAALKLAYDFIDKFDQNNTSKHVIINGSNSELRLAVKYVCMAKNEIQNLSGSTEKPYRCTDKKDGTTLENKLSQDRLSSAIEYVRKISGKPIEAKNTGSIAASLSVSPKATRPTEPPAPASPARPTKSVKSSSRKDPNITAKRKKIKKTEQANRGDFTDDDPNRPAR